MREAYLSHVRKWDAEFRKEPIFEGLVKLPAQFLDESHSRPNFLKWPSLSKVLNGSAAPLMHATGKALWRQQAADSLPIERCGMSLLKRAGAAHGAFSLKADTGGPQKIL